MLTLSIGNQFTRKYIYAYATSTSKPNKYSLHILHNKFKRFLGDKFGENMYTINDNDKFIEKYVLWKSERSKEGIQVDDNIGRFIMVNDAYKKDTVFFENHWKYKVIIYTVQFSCVYYIVFTMFSTKAFILVTTIYLVGLARLVFGKGNTLVALAHLRQTHENIMLGTNTKTLNSCAQQKI